MNEVTAVASDADGVGWVRLGVRGTIPPGAFSEVDGATAEVTEVFTVTVSGITFMPEDPERLEPGVDVRVKRSNGGVYARPVSESDRGERGGSGGE